MASKIIELSVHPITQLKLILFHNAHSYSDTPVTTITIDIIISYLYNNNELLVYA